MAITNFLLFNWRILKDFIRLKFKHIKENKEKIIMNDLKVEKAFNFFNKGGGKER